MVYSRARFSFRAKPDIELKMYDFFKYRKKTFLLSFFFYVVTGIFFIIQFKFLLLSIGISASIFQLILIINVWGLMNFVPSPGSVGFLEASQFGLFHVLMGSGATGLAMTLILRIAYLSTTCLGFLFLSHFSMKQIKEDKKSKKR